MIIVEQYSNRYDSTQIKILKIISMRKDYKESDLLELVRTMLVPASAFRPCDDEESSLIMSLALCELRRISIDEGIRMDPMYRLIQKRLQLYDYRMSEHAITFLASLSTTPGVAVIYMTYLQYISSKLGIKEYNVYNLCEKAIPYGILKSEVLEEFWDAQKAASAPLSNMVDDIECIKYIANYEKVR